MSGLPTAAAYRAAAQLYLTAEAWRWAAQLRFDRAVRARAVGPLLQAQGVLWAAVAALTDATTRLELAEWSLRAAIPNPLVLPDGKDPCP